MQHSLCEMVLSEWTEVNNSNCFVRLHAKNKAFYTYAEQKSKLRQEDSISAKSL